MKESKIYINKGLPVFPLVLGLKSPIKGCNWRAEDLKPYQDMMLKQDYNIGLVMGKSSGLVAIDFDYDVDGLHDPIYKIAGESPTIKIGAKGFTAFYKYNGEKKKQYTKDGKVIIDFLGEGSYTVMPPSLHPEGMQYHFSHAGNLVDLDMKRCPYLPTDFFDKLDVLLGNTKKPEIKPSTCASDVSKKDIEEALTYISPETYETWTNVGMTLKSSNIEDSYEMWMKWNEDYLENNPNSKRPGTEEYRWSTYSADGGLTVATLFKMAMDNGYKKQDNTGISLKGSTSSLVNNPSNPLCDISESLEVIKGWKKDDTFPVGEHIGIGGFNSDTIKWRLRKKEFSVITGVPGSGKSEFLNFMCYKAAETQGYKTFYCSFEESKEELIESHLTRHAGKTIDKRSDEEVKKAGEFIIKHCEFYNREALGNQIETMIETCRTLENKVDIMVIDTFSKIRSAYGCSEGDMNHVKLTIQLLSQACKDLDIHIFLVAHPTKSGFLSQQKGISLKEIAKPKPDLYMVSGGAVFNNDADNGFVIEAEAGYISRVHICKIKKTHYGDKKGEVTFRYDVSSRRFKDIDQHKIINKY